MRCENCRNEVGSHVRLGTMYDDEQLSVSMQICIPELQAKLDEHIKVLVFETCKKTYEAINEQLKSHGINICYANTVAEPA